MSRSADTLDQQIPGIAAVPIFGIARKMPLETIDQVAEVAYQSGLRVIEVTLDSTDPFGQIQLIASKHPDLTVGAGSVLDAAQVRDAVEAGVRFVVSPIVDEGVIEAALASGTAVVPGAATPTEVMRALRVGATAVKVFPIAQLGGVPYLKAIMSPLQNPPLIPTGGVTPASAADFLRAGAVAIGAGSDLMSASLIESDGVEAIAKRVQAWVEAVRV